jgi:hypothetical protein
LPEAPTEAIQLDRLLELARDAYRLGLHEDWAARTEASRACATRLLREIEVEATGARRG